MALVECPCVHKDPAPDWRSDPLFLGIYEFEEIGKPALADIRDSSINQNDLSNPGGGMPQTTRASFVRQQCRANSHESTVGEFTCDLPECNASDFCPVLKSFTVGCWEYPTDTGAASERWTVSTDGANGTTGSGYNIGWRQPSGGVGNFLFQVDHTAVSAEVQLNTFISYTPDVYHHHVGRFLYTDGFGATMAQFIDGVQDASTLGVAGIGTCDDFTLGVGPFNRAMAGFWDECFVADGALDAESICRIAVCGIDGCGCSCDSGTPANYDSRPRHVTDGGAINCTMPACNQAGPGVATTTSSTTSTSTTTSSSTTSSSTTTSTSSTTTTTL